MVLRRDKQKDLKRLRAQLDALKRKQDENRPVPKSPTPPTQMLRAPTTARGVQPVMTDLKPVITGPKPTAPRAAIVYRRNLPRIATARTEDPVAVG